MYYSVNRILTNFNDMRCATDKIEYNWRKCHQKIHNSKQYIDSRQTHVLKKPKYTLCLVTVLRLHIIISN